MEERSVTDPTDTPEVEDTAAPEPSGDTPAASTTEAQPFATFPDADSFRKRVEREARKHLRELGITDPAEVKSILAEHAQLKEAAQEAERAKMGEIERLQADLQAAKEAREAAELQAEELRVKQHLTSVFARNGVTNHDYAMWRFQTKLAEMDEDEELDEDAFIAELAQDATTRAALGMKAPEGTPDGEAPPVAPPTRPANTAVPHEKPAASNGGLPSKTAMDMTPEEWVKHKQELGLST